MNGSEKQIVWATDILAGIRSSLENGLSGLLAGQAARGDKFGSEDRDLIAQAHAGLASLDAIADAKFVIDNRRSTGRILPGVCVSEIEARGNVWVILLKNFG